MTELLTIQDTWHIPYNYDVGPCTSKFFINLRDNKKLMATKCSKCNRVLMPPRSFCERCFSKAEQWVEVGPEGTIQNFTIVLEKFAGNPDPPFALAYVRLDGADTAMLNHVTDLDFSDIPKLAGRLRMGNRVSVVFQDEREGKITDFMYKLLEI